MRIAGAIDVARELGAVLFALPIDPPTRGHLGGGVRFVQVTERTVYDPLMGALPAAPILPVHAVVGQCC